MLFTLLKNDKIVTGPRDWNPKYFEYFLRDECGIDTKLPEYHITDDLLFGESVKLVQTFEEILPEVNPSFERLAGPNFKFEDSGKHISYYVVSELPINSIHNNLLSIISNNRWIAETTPIVRDINGKSITIYTDRGSRTSYTQALMLADENYSAQWKFAEGFFTLNKADLQLIVNEVVAYVQSCFDWESEKSNEIISKNSVDDLKAIKLDFEIIQKQQVLEEIIPQTDITME